MPKKVIRRRPRVEEPPPAAKKPARKPKSHQVAWVRPGRSSAGCSCGKVEVELAGEDVIVRGNGWLKEGQWICCGGCSARIRFAPRVTWETADGNRYTTREYLGEGESRRIS